MSNYQPYAPRPAEPARRPLTRSRDRKMVAGVCAGFADYTGLDVTLVRIVLVAATIFGVGTPLLVYAAGWLLMPEQPWPSPYATSLRDSSTESANP